MEKDTLSRVIEAEKEIQKRIELETLKAEEWLANVKKETEAQFQIEEKKIKDTLEESKLQASKEADRRAAEITAAAMRAAERLAQLETKTLQEIIEKRIARILPG